MADNAMQVTLSDPVVEVRGWTLDLNKLGEYTLRKRKTPEEIEKEKKELKDKYPDRKPVVKQYRETRKTVISVIEQDGERIARFLPGLWPRVQRELKANGVQYDIVDRRNPDIRPELDYTAFAGLEFRENQDVAVALIAKCDCGIIETATAFGKTTIISYLCKAYPSLNIVVTTSSQQVVATIYDRIKQLIPGEVGVLYAGHNNIEGKRVIVTTLKSLATLKPEKVHLVFVDEC